MTLGFCILPSCSINKSCDDINKFSKLQILSIFMAQTINDIGLFSRQLKVPNEYKELAELLKRHTYEFKEFNPQIAGQRIFIAYSKD